MQGLLEKGGAQQMDTDWRRRSNDLYKSTDTERELTLVAVKMKNRESSDIDKHDTSVKRASTLLKTGMTASHGDSEDE